MELIEKRYPYPVLLPEGDDYPGCKFIVIGQSTITSDNVTLEFNVNLDCQSLRELVEQGKAQIICHVECPQAAYRHAFSIPLGGTSIQIASGHLSGKVSICPFIVASQDIPDYSSSLFDKPYEGMSFHIWTGAVLAEGEQLRFFVETAREDLEYQPDIFSIQPHECTGEDKDLMLIDLSGEKIRIQVPRESFALYRSLRQSGEVNEMLWSALVVPALIEAINEMKRVVESEQNLDELDKDMWSRVLSVQIKKLFPAVDKDPVAVYRDIQASKVAQMLIKKPIPRMLRKLSDAGDRYDEQEGN